MLRKIGLVLLGIIVLLVAVIVSRPSEYRVERSASINAPPAVVFDFVNDFHKWEGWSPWEKLDPSMKKTYEGPATGAGAVYSWTGNDKVGEGRMTITDSRPGESVAIKLEFIKPFAAVCNTTFTFSPQGTATKVSWTMEGSNNFVAKAFTLFMNMDDMIGKDFEKGLAQLRTQAETAARERATATAAAAPPAQPTIPPAVAPTSPLKPDAPGSTPPPAANP